MNNLSLVDSDISEQIKSKYKEISSALKPDTLEYLKKSNYKFNNDLHFYTLNAICDKNLVNSKSIVCDLILNSYWDLNFIWVKEGEKEIGTKNNKKSCAYRHNILFYLITHTYPINILEHILDKGQISLDIFDTNSNNLIQMVIYRSEYAYTNFFVKLLKLSSRDDFTHKNSRGKNCWDICLELKNTSWYAEKIISCGKFDFTSYASAYTIAIKNFSNKKISDLYDNLYPHLYKILDWKSIPDRLKISWDFYYTMSKTHYFEDIVGIFCNNQNRLNNALDWIKIIGWYCCALKYNDIDIELFNSISGKFIISFFHGHAEWIDFYSGIQFVLANATYNLSNLNNLNNSNILPNNNLSLILKAIGYIEDYHGVKFYCNVQSDFIGLSNCDYAKIKILYFELYNKIYNQNEINKIIEGEAKLYTDKDNIIVRIIFNSVILSLKNKANINLIKSLLMHIISIDSEYHKFNDKHTYTYSLVNKINWINNHKHKKIVKFIVHEYECNYELIMLLCKTNFLSIKAYSANYTNTIICDLLEEKKYDVAIKLIEYFELKPDVYFYSPNPTISSIFIYCMEKRNSEQVYDIIKKIGEDVFIYMTRYNPDGLDLQTDYVYPNDLALYWSCKNKMTNIALFLLDNQLSNPNYVDSYGMSVLMWACANSMKRCALELIENSQVDTTILNINKQSALDYAVGNKLESVATKLVEKLVNLLSGKPKTILLKN